MTGKDQGRRTTIRTARRQSEKAGLPPGSLVFVGERKLETVTINAMRYDESTLEEGPLSREIDVRHPAEITGTLWIGVEGLHDPESLERLGSALNIPPLLLEDVLNTKQLPKLDEQDGRLCLIIKEFSFGEGEIASEQIGMILGERLLVTLREQPGASFDAVRRRIRTSSGRIRRHGSDYLLYALTDSVIDSYFSILEEIGDRLESIEEEVLSSPGTDTVRKIYSLRRQILFLRRSVRPLREILGNLRRDGGELISDAILPYLSDLHDHVMSVMDTLENYRDIVAGLLDLYLSSLSNRMNEVMKVLTVIATLFIPLTFIVGVYGMNFKFIPELEWHLGYFAVWGIMVVIFVLMTLWFRRRGWF